ncbi:MAG: hypothetical protein KC589_07215 [Nanoarchaeota archaeon]|nr:hypothetical protein [Nanoarchaeota archaeon]
MLSFKLFKEAQKRISLLLLENKLTDDYWLKLSYDDLLYLIKNNKLRNKKNILFVTKSSDHSSIYNDIYEYPVSIYFDKMKLYKLIIDKEYKSSIDKDDSINEEIETTNDHFDEIDTNNDLDSDIKDDDLLTNTEINNTEINDLNSDKKEVDTKEKQNDISLEDLPEEISINEKEVDIDPKNNIKIIEIDLERIDHLLDKEVISLSKMLNISRSIKNKSYEESRNKIAEKFKSVTSDFCSLNNIVINFID